MILVGVTGGRWIASSIATVRPSPATRRSPSTETAVGAPSSRIRRNSVTWAPVRRSFVSKLTCGPMAELQGFMFPRSATGSASLLPPPPWHYSGTMLTLEYRTDPAAVAELLPAPLAPADDDPG